MVNYCCVYGCGRNSRVNKHLNYYSLPKGNDRQEQWLRAAGREDLLEKALSSSTRFCSRHFPPSQIKKKHLSPDAVPSLCLPGSSIHENHDTEPEKHNGVVCNGCSDSIIGFRYKCIVCHDYDLCQKCEMHEVHPDHIMLRIPKPIKFKKVDNLITKWHDIVSSEQDTPGCMNSNSENDSNHYLSSDDEPITKYTKEYDSGVDLTDDVKRKLRNEVARVLKISCKSDNKQTTQADIPKKRPAESNKPSKRLRTEVTSDNYKKTEDSHNTHEIQELAFADVDNVKVIKRETTVQHKPLQDKELYVVLTSDMSNLMR